MSQIIESKTREQLIQSMLMEAAKAANELRSAKSDLNKLSSRLSFLLVIINELIDRDDREPLKD